VPTDALRESMSFPFPRDSDHNNDADSIEGDGHDFTPLPLSASDDVEEEFSPEVHSYLNDLSE